MRNERDAISISRTGGNRIDHTTVHAGEPVTTTDTDGDQYRQGSSTPESPGPDDIGVESPEVMELRAHLERIQDRLSFYEGFDRVITENVRRSGELMEEMLAMRESMTASAQRESQRERERIAAHLGVVDSDFDAIRVQIDGVAGQLTDLRRSLEVESHRPPAADHDSPSVPPERASVAPSAAVHNPDSSLVNLQPAPVPPPAPVRTPATPTAPGTPGAEWDSPQVIDVIAHHVTRATIALSLQRYLGDLNAVAGVEAREFAEGVLRMQVTANQPFTRHDFSGWKDGGHFTVVELQPNIVELALETGA